MYEKERYQLTIYACYLGYIVQGIINNINPILFVIYQRQLRVSLTGITVLIALNFGVQILVDLLAARYVDYLGYRFSMVLAHVCAVLGLLSMGILPRFMANPMAGLVFATILNAVGGGLLEVLVSPIVEAAPGDAKEQAMSLLHSFYCWGCVGFIAVSTVMIRALGGENWYWVPVGWAVVPFVNLFLFTRVPIARVTEEEEQMSAKELFSQGTFWLLAALMICSGASEQGMSQWASYFAELGLGVDKTMGDLLGPCFFCILMGTSRLIFGKSQGKFRLPAFMKGSCLLCIVSYLLAVLAPHPLLGLLGCGLCGLSVGILWPGTFSIAAKTCKGGGTVLFAFLALAGDLGCVSGPQLVGAVSQLLPEFGLKAGLFSAIVFPAALVVVLGRLLKKHPKTDMF